MMRGQKQTVRGWGVGGHDLRGQDGPGDGDKVCGDRVGMRESVGRTRWWWRWTAFPVQLSMNYVIFSGYRLTIDMEPVW